jgi:hypothetical protein
MEATISFDEEITMKASTPALTATCAMLGFLLLLAPPAARADLVWSLQCEGLRPPECGDGRENDDPTDNAKDYPKDLQCTSLDDDDEGIPGFQQQPSTCRSTILRIKFPQGFRIPDSDHCPECYWVELIDFSPLLDAPWSKVVKPLPETWKPSTHLTLDIPVPGLKDDPGIPNLRFQYVGRDEIVGPAVVGKIALRKPFAFPAGIQYVGQAFDTRAGKLVTNVGTLGPDPAARPGRDGLFDARLSYSRWNSGGTIGSLKGFDVELCPSWPRPWPPRFDLRISSYKIDKAGFSRATPLELGILFPFSSTSRVTPYLGAGVGYYLINGNSAAAQDELGGYGALGVDIRLADRWGLNLEGAYRKVGGSLDLGGPVFKAGLGLSF